MASEYAGVYTFLTDDGKFEEFLKAMNVGLVTRKMANTTKPTITIKVNDDGTIEVETKSTFKTSTLAFKLGEEFEEKRMDGVTCKTVISKDGNKLVQIQNSEPKVEIIREFADGKMITTCKCGDAVCVREYKKN